MWRRTDLTDLLKIEHPIIQAPMAGLATPALAAAVSNAGGLGSLGCASASAEEIKEKVDQLRAATNRSFNLNFFAHSAPNEDSEVDEQTRTRVAPFYEELGLGDIPLQSELPFDPFDVDRLTVLLDIKPAVTSFHFGLPEPEMVKALKDAGCVILCSATTVAEAKWLEAASVDAIIAQGWEAGGHRGSFDVSFEDVGVGSMALIPQVVDAVDVPVIAAGGIADGRGIAAAFALGASGVQLGTAFLSCPEAQVRDVHRAALRHASDQDTRLTRAITGRPARAKNNSYIEAMAEHRTRLPDFPKMCTFSEPLRQFGYANEDSDIQFLLYGQAAALNRELPAAELIQVLVDEAQGIIGSK